MSEDTNTLTLSPPNHDKLGAGIENPEYGFENLAGRNWLAAWTFGRNMFLRKMFPDAFPLFVA
jgi:hypothetical protein